MDDQLDRLIYVKCDAIAQQWPDVITKFPISLLGSQVRQKFLGRYTVPLRCQIGNAHVNYNSFVQCCLPECIIEIKKVAPFLALI